MTTNDDVFHGHPRAVAYSVVTMVVSILGVIASIVTIVLIRRMKEFTGHVYLLYLMSIFQLMFDVFFFFAVVNIDYYLIAVSKGMALFGGATSAIISNWIAFIALYVVWYRKRVDIFKNINAVYLTAFVPGFITGSVSFISHFPESNPNPTMEKINLLYVYNTIRLLSIFCNFIFTVLIIVKVFHQGSAAQTPQDAAIRTLARRMIYYPITQAISRSGYSWYEYAYGIKFDTDDTDNTKYASMIFASIITPTVSMGYLFIFLIMQPNAYQEFKRMLWCQRSSLDEDNDNATRNNYRDKEDASTDPMDDRTSKVLNIDDQNEEELYAIIADSESLYQATFHANQASTLPRDLYAQDPAIELRLRETNDIFTVNNIIHHDYGHSFA